MKLDSVSFCYEGRRKPALERIRLRADPGEFVLLCGPSGCGKTTLTRVLNGLCPEFYPGRLVGGYVLGETDMTALSIKEKSSMVGSVFQDPETQFFATRGYDEIVFGSEQRAVSAGRIRARLEELNRLLRLESLYGKDLFSMSSGEKQKIAVASACMLSPRMLVLDEPSANLDTQSALKLGTILAGLKEAGVSIVLSEHRAHYVKGVFDRALYIEGGRVLEDFAARDALALSGDELADRGLRPFEAPALRPLQDPSAYDGPSFCKTEALGFSYGSARVLEGLDLTIPQGRVTVVLGGNGAGQTKLLRVLSGLLEPSSGAIAFRGRSLSRRARIGQSFLLEQNGSNQIFSNRVEREFLIDVPGQSARDIRRTLEDLGLWEKRDLHPLRLSGGEKQRLLVGVSSLSAKKLLLLDEPTSGLDAANARRVSALLRRNAEQGQTVVIATHDVEFANRTADFAIRL